MRYFSHSSHRGVRQVAAKCESLIRSIKMAGESPGRLVLCPVPPGLAVSRAAGADNTGIDGGPKTFSTSPRE